MDLVHTPPGEASNKSDSLFAIKSLTCTQNKLFHESPSESSPTSSGGSDTKSAAFVTPVSLSTQSIILHTPSPAQSGKIMLTPLSRRFNIRNKENGYSNQNIPFYNPFERGTDVLHLPTVSPSLFREVVSPSVKEDEKFAWSIDQLAVLHPSNIETSPFGHFQIPTDPEYERTAQEAINRFFSSQAVVPSPWINGNPPVNTSSVAASPLLQGDNLDTSKNHVWTQTHLSLPPVLPKELEAALAPFCTFNQDQSSQLHPEELEENASLNNTTLRRKLLFNNGMEDLIPTSSVENHDEANDPLPLEDEDTVHPWGASMIRPSSRLTLSPPCKERCSSPSGSIGGRRSATPLRDVSPIRRFSPAEFRTERSPMDIDRDIPSPGLSPIGSIDTKYTKPLTIQPPSPVNVPTLSSSTVGVPVSILEELHKNCSSPNSSLLQMHHIGSCVASRRASSESMGTNFNNMLTNDDSCYEGYDEPDGGDYDMMCNSHDDISHQHQIDDDEINVNSDYTSPKNLSSPRINRNKTSPQFSSSPIREEASSYRRRKRQSNEGLKCSSPISGSLPVSPISWSVENPEFQEPSRYQDSKCMQHSEVISDTGYLGLRTNSAGERGLSSELNGDSLVISQQYLETSAMEDTNSGQDTGYQTGTSSLQNLNVNLGSGLAHSMQQKEQIDLL